jgi:hypothetical protein
MVQALQQLAYRRPALLLLLTFGMAVILVCVNRSPSQLLDPRILTAYMARSAAIVLLIEFAAVWSRSKLSIRWGILLVFLGALLLNGIAHVLLHGGLTMTDLATLSGLAAFFAVLFAWSASHKRRNTTDRRTVSRDGFPENHAVTR